MTIRNALIYQDNDGAQLLARRLVNGNSLITVKDHGGYFGQVEIPADQLDEILSDLRHELSGGSR